MGAGVAAGPHCPIAGGHQAWEARQSAWDGFGTLPGPGALAPVPGVPSRSAGSVRGVPAGSPSGPKPWRFAAWRIWNSRPASRLPVTAAEALVPEPAGSLAEAAGSAWQVHEPKLWALAGFAAPGTRPGPARQSVRPKPPFCRWRCVNPEIPLSAGQAFHPEGCPSCLPDSVRPGASGFGWALHEACRFRIRQRASPQLPPGGGFVSRPASARALRLVGRKGSSLGPWPGRLSSVAGRSSLTTKGRLS
jgi:hypothetical protein